MSRAMWNPWHGCKRVSEGCKNCYVYLMDNKRGIDPSIIRRSKTAFYLPLQKNRAGNHKIEAGTEVGVCFTSDFFIEEADAFRKDAWDVIRTRSDVRFLIPTKRVNRLTDCIPDDFGEGWENVTVSVSVENNRAAADRLPYLIDAPLKHKAVFAAPLLEEVDLSVYLKSGEIEYVSAAGESYENARECRFEWIVRLKQQCDFYGVKFDYHQTGSNFVKDGKRYRIPHRKEYEQAKKAFADQAMSPRF